MTTTGQESPPPTLLRPHEIPAGLAPLWESRYPGRFQHELDRLEHAHARPRVHLAALQAGRLVVTLHWEVRDLTVELMAAFPDAYPHFRPQVLLVGGLDPPPVKHRSPLDGNLCLLGREPRQWTTDYTLEELLSDMLEGALFDVGERDPQGEPVEFWWNALGVRGSYCLIQSGWDLQGQHEGLLDLRYHASEHQKEPPLICSYVAEVRSEANSLIQWSGPLPKLLRSGWQVMTVPWALLDQSLLPSVPLQAVLDPILERYPRLKQCKEVRLRNGSYVEVFVMVHPSELGHDRMGLAWTPVVIFGRKRRKHQNQRGITVLPTYRAGNEDLGQRVPAVRTLSGKSVLVVGTGAVGAPAAIELARNGCQSLHLIDYDVVEPGNTVRWPLGASAWGRLKVECVCEHIQAEYPGTTVTPHVLNLGQAAPGADERREDGLLSQVVDSVDLVLDASASFGVTTLLAERCSRARVPLVCMYGTASLEGGVVARHSGGGGCPTCLEHAWEKGELPVPPGRDREEDLIQPPGCSERTFPGAGFDLQEIALQGVRLVVDTLSDDGPTSVLQILSFVDGNGRRRAPRWHEEPLPRHPDCSCGP